MKALIIGCGYVGSALAIHWAAEGHELTVTTTSPERVSELEKIAAAAVVFDSTNPDGLEALVAGKDVIVVCVAPKRGRQHQDTYVPTAQALAAVMDDQHLIYTSSTSVYSEEEGAWVNESSGLKPDSESLVQTEKIIGELPHSCILRLSGIYGPGREIARRTRFFSGKEVAGSGDKLTNHIHRDDIVRAIAWAASTRATGIYNVSNDSHPTRAELYGRLCEEQGIPLPRWDSSQPAKRSGDKRISNEKIKSEGFTFAHPTI